MKNWNERDRQPEPITTPLVFRGVVYALLIEGCVLAVLLPLFYGLGWL